MAHTTTARKHYLAMSPLEVRKIATESPELTDVEREYNLRWYAKGDEYDAEMETYRQALAMLEKGQDYPALTGRPWPLLPKSPWAGKRSSLPPILPPPPKKPIGRPRNETRGILKLTLELPTLLLARLASETQGKISVEDYILNVLTSLHPSE